MDNIQFFTVLGSIFGCFAWMIHRIAKLAERVNEVEKDVCTIKGILSVTHKIDKAA